MNGVYSALMSQDNGRLNRLTWTLDFTCIVKDSCSNVTGLLVNLPLV